MSDVEKLLNRIEGAEELDAYVELATSTAHDLLVKPPLLDSLLGGDWLGHRVHPVAAQVPMGAWMMASLLSLSGRAKYDAAVDRLLLVGILAALPTAASGAHDLATAAGAESRRVGLVHAGVMDAALALVAAGWISRKRGHRRRGRALVLAGTTVAGAGAYLGGHLVCRQGVGVFD